MREREKEEEKEKDKLKKEREGKKTTKKSRKQKTAGPGGWLANTSQSRLCHGWPVPSTSEGVYRVCQAQAHQSCGIWTLKLATFSFSFKSSLRAAVCRQVAFSFLLALG